MKQILTFLIATAVVAHAELIPAIRLITWQAGTQQGVPGGIPVRTNLINVTSAPYLADPTGVDDSGPAIEMAIAASAPNDVIYIPNGTYKVSEALNPKPNTTIRGQSRAGVLLDFTTSDAGIVSNAYTDGMFYPIGYSVLATGGVTKGSTTVTVASGDSAAFTVGRIMQLVRESSTSQSDNPIVIHPYFNGDYNSAYNWGFRQIVKVVSKTATSITFFPAIYHDMSGDFDVRLVAGVRDQGGLGIESLTMDLTGTGVQNGINFWEQIGSWVKDVRVIGPANRGISASMCLFLEVRDSIFEGPGGASANGAGFLLENVCASLFENNIIHNFFPTIQVNAGSSGNIFGYNFSLNDNGTHEIDTNHGWHNTSNLYEGNVANELIADGYYGSVSSDTIFRNWLHAVHAGFALTLKRFTRNYSLVGNVFCSPAWTQSYDGTAMGQPNISNGDSIGTGPPWSTWLAGDPPGISGYQELDLGVQATLVRKGNWDYYNDAQESLGGDSLPNSLYLSGKPAWFGVLTWPPVNPAAPGSPTLTQIYEKIPSGYFYVHGSYPASETGDTTAPTPDPMTFASGPTATDSATITMTATTASDAGGGIQYLFDETTGGTGANDSNWQDAPLYIDTGLTASTLYTYRVKARDASMNETTLSSPASATTASAGGVPGGIGTINVQNLRVGQ